MSNNISVLETSLFAEGPVHRSQHPWIQVVISWCLPRARVPHSWGRMSSAVHYLSNCCSFQFALSPASERSELAKRRWFSV